MLYDVLRDGADPGANLGTAFTASLPDQQIIPKGKYLDHFLIGIRGAVSTAAVTLTNFLAVLNPFIVKAGSETRIQLRARDLLALCFWYYERGPIMWENTDNTGQDFVLGIKVPFQEVMSADQVYTYSATRVAVTNIGTEQLALQAVYMDDDHGRKPIIAVELPYTTAGATGYTQLGVTLPPVGKLLGLIVFNTTVPTDGASAFDTQRIQIYENGVATSKLLGAVSGLIPSGLSDGTLQSLSNLMANYHFYDFRDEPLDCKNKAITFGVDVENTSASTRFIAVMQKEA